MSRQQAVPTVRVDDDRVLATEWAFAPDAETGWHRHGMDYMVIPLEDGVLHAEMPDGSVMEAVLTKGVPYTRPEGVEHNVMNASGKAFSFLEIEFKKPE